MARGKKSGAAARDGDSDSDFNPKRKSPTKKRGSPQKKSTSPRKGQKRDTQDTVDEGIAATPDDIFLPAQVENDDSTYASSPPKQTTQTTLFQTPGCKTAARSSRSKKFVLDLNSGSFEVEAVSETPAVGAAGAQSKVVVLKVAPDKLRRVFEANAHLEKKVTLKLPSEKLREVQQKLVEEELGPEPEEQPEVPRGGQPARMAPVKDKSPHDVLDGESFASNRFLAAAWILIANRTGQFKDVIQNLYDMASITHGYLPESQGPLVNKG